MARDVERWEVLERKKVYEGRVFSLETRRCRSSDRGEVHDFQVIDSRDWVNVVPVTPDERVVLIRQFRHGVSDLTLEVPGGMVDPGETPLDAARRELREETGYEARDVREIGCVHPNPAIQSNRCFSFVARGAERRHETAFDSTEDIEVVLEPLARIPELLRSGAITHALVIDAFHWLRLAEEP